MIKIIKQLLLKVIQDIDAGNSNINEEDAMEIITQNSYKYFECSALTGNNVNEIINSLLDDIIIRDQLLPEMKKEQKKKCIIF